MGGASKNKGNRTIRGFFLDIWPLLEQILHQLPDQDARAEAIRNVQLAGQLPPTVRCFAIIPWHLSTALSTGGTKALATVATHAALRTTSLVLG